MSDVLVAMIAAVGRNGVIGADNALPWRLPTDFRFYKDTTMGKPLVMGRKTFESIGRALPGRTSIVVSRAGFIAPEGVLVFADLDEAVAAARMIAARDGQAEAFINGGETLYRAMLERADRLYITHVDAAPEGDAYFPRFDPDGWTATPITGYAPGERDSHAFTHMRYDRAISPGFD